MPADQRGSRPGSHSVGPRNMNVKWLNRRAHSTDDLAGPERLGQQGHPAVLRFANRAKCVAIVRLLIRVQAALRQIALKCGIGGLHVFASPDAKGFAFKAFKNLTQLLLIWLWQNDATLRRFSQRNFVKLAKLSYAVDVTEKIHNVRLASRKGRKHRRPNLRGILAVHRFAVFRFDQFEPYGFHVAAKVQRLHIQGKRRQLQRTASRRRRSGRIHSSDSDCGNLARKSGDCFRTSSQSKKASGVSSQIRNHPAISTFSARFWASTLRLREIISARRLPRRATSKTRSTAACSPCARNLRINSSSRIMLTSASSSVLKCKRSSNSSSYCSSASSI